MLMHLDEYIIIMSVLLDSNTDNDDDQTRINNKIEFS